MEKKKLIEFRNIVKNFDGNFDLKLFESLVEYYK